MARALTLEQLVPALGPPLRRAAAALRKCGIEFAIIGAVALGKRGRPRTTDDIDLLVDPSRWEDAVDALRGVGFVGRVDPLLTMLRDRESGVGLDVLFGVGDPEETARLAAEDLAVFGRRVPVARAQDLLWLYLNSTRVQHRADAINLVNHGRVDIRKVDRALEEAGERQLRIKLRDVLHEAERERR